MTIFRPFSESMCRIKINDCRFTFLVLFAEASSLCVGGKKSSGKSIRSSINLFRKRFHRFFFSAIDISSERFKLFDGKFLFPPRALSAIIQPAMEAYYSFWVIDWSASRGCFSHLHRIFYLLCAHSFSHPALMMSTAGCFYSFLIPPHTQPEITIHLSTTVNIIEYENRKSSSMLRVTTMPEHVYSNLFIIIFVTCRAPRRLSCAHNTRRETQKRRGGKKNSMRRICARGMIE